MSRTIPILGFATLALANTLPAYATDVHTKVLASTCYICHGPEGRSTTAIPPLAGIDKEYFVSSMKAFRAGERQSSVMMKYATGYKDDEYLKLGEFFAGLKK